MSRSAADGDAVAASIVIVSYNRRADLHEALAALPCDRLEAHRTEVIVVDDGSTDGTSEMILAEFPHVRHLRNDMNRGPSYSRNRASREARGMLLLYLDSDSVPSAEWLGNMLEHDDGDSILIGAVRDYDGDRLQNGPRRTTFLGKSVRCAPERANTGPSCNLGVPKRCFDAIDGFDEELPYYFEDSDLCIRARRAGFGAKYLFDAEVRHKGNETKHGHAAWMQERNSTYAMLKGYRSNPLAILAFALLNTGWALARAPVYILRGYPTDARAVLLGNLAGYRDFMRGSTNDRVRR